MPIKVNPELEKCLSGGTFRLKAILDDDLGIVVGSELFVPKGTHEEALEEFSRITKMCRHILLGEGFSAKAIPYPTKAPEKPKADPAPTPAPEPPTPPEPSQPQEPTVPEVVSKELGTPEAVTSPTDGAYTEEMTEKFTEMQADAGLLKLQTQAPEGMRLIHHPESSCYFLSPKGVELDPLCEDVTGIPEHEAAALEFFEAEKARLVKEMEKAAIKPPEPVEVPKGYLADLPQPFEWMRLLLTSLMNAGADEATLQLLLNAAAEAKQLGKLAEWKKIAEPGIVGSLNQKRHPGEFIPAMIKHLQGKISEAYAGQDEEVRTVIIEVAKLVDERFKGQFYDDIDDLLKRGAAQFFKEAWDETSIGVAEGRVHAPSRCWRKIVITKLTEHQTAMMQAPIQIPENTAVSWVKPWLPTYEGKLNPDNIKTEFQPFAKRDTTEHRVEAAYYDMRDNLLNKKNGVPIDTLVTAWSGPEAPALMNMWINGMSKEYQDDGKRYAFTQQSFDVMATAFFLDVIKRCSDWMDVHREELKGHMKIKALYRQVFPEPKEGENA